MYIYRERKRERQREIYRVIHIPIYIWSQIWGPVCRCTPQKGTGLRGSSLFPLMGWTWRRPFSTLSLVGVDLDAPSEIVLWLGAGPSCQPVRMSHPSLHIEVDIGRKCTPKVSTIEPVFSLLVKSSPLSWTCYLPYQIDFGPSREFVFVFLSQSGFTQSPSKNTHEENT